MIFNKELADIFDQANGDGIHLRALRHDQRPEQIIVLEDEHDDRQRGNVVTCQRQDDAPEDAKFGCAINTGGVQQIIGHA
jgi:hypothetical protein